MTTGFQAALVTLALALLGWAMSLRRARRALQAEVGRRISVEQEKQRLAAIVECSGDAVLTTALDGRILTWSAGAERMYGYSAREVEGRHVALLHRPEVKENGDDLPRRAALENRSFQLETVNRTKDDRDIEVGLTIFPLRSGGGEIIGACTVARDITGRKALERVTDQFLGAVSHELRTPLTAIRGFVELVAEGEAGPVNETQREFLDITARNAERLGALINDLLDSENIESRRLEIRREPVDLEAVLSEVAGRFRQPAGEKGLAFREEVHPLPLVAGDRDRLVQLFGNLVSNAIKFTPRGEVGLFAAPTHDGVEVVVSDTGIGLTAEDQERVFAKFFRGTHPVVAEAGGTGLGLAIVKALVQRHRGTIQVESEAGRGSRFRVVLPRLG
jgi:PAS domain S-box-containing protein